MLLLRLAKHGVDIVTVGFFAWVALLPTFKFAWAPVLDKYDIPGFGRFWGKRRGWIMLAQFGIFASMAGMALTASDFSLPLTALFATLLAFWTTTLEIAADAWRIELAPTAAEQGPLVAANLWGYRSAMAGSGAAVAIVPAWDWSGAYMTVAVISLLAFPFLVMTKAGQQHGGGRWTALTTGTLFSAVTLALTGLAVALAGWLLLKALGSVGLDNPDIVKYWVFGVALVPFVALAAAVPWLRRLPPDAPLRRSAAIGPYVNVAWRYGVVVVPLLLFISIYRMGDVMAATFAPVLFNALGYGLAQIGVANGLVFAVASMIGVAFGGWLATRASMGWALVIGAAVSAISNWVFAWLAHQHPGGAILFTMQLPGFHFPSWSPDTWQTFFWSAPVTSGDMKLYFAMAVDQFGHGFEGAVFVVYLSLLVNPRYPAAQYALFSGLAFLIPRLVAGLSGAIQKSINYDGFFIMAGAMSLGAVVFLPFVLRARPRPDDT
ncbi:permease [Sphingomonas sp.]|uniref:permease n=1 Tax=Sphingomonas sp. TaxID=28214 RepID=UPI0025F7921E|nr:permease [Sphingomonas sp.]